MKKQSNFVYIFCALITALIFRVFLISVYKIPTNSMQPTFLPGDFIISSQISYGLKIPWSGDSFFESKPQKGDLVVFKFKGKPVITYIKRVTAVEGDNVILSDGKTQTVPAGEVYVASDNPDMKGDDHEGFSLIQDIDSQAKLIWFSYSKESGVRWPRIFTRP